MTIDPNVAREEAQAVLDLKDALNQAIVSAWEKGLLINIVIGEREHAVARIHPYDRQRAGIIDDIGNIIIVCQLPQQAFQGWRAVFILCSITVAGSVIA